MGYPFLLIALLDGVTKGYCSKKTSGHTKTVRDAHHDHIECVKYFDQAHVYIQKEEYPKGKRYIPEHYPVFLFDEECRITDDIRCIKIGGHTIGSSIVEVKWDDRVYVLCGDECYTRDNFRKRIATGNSFCKEKSEQFARKYSGEQYVCLLCHDNSL